MNDAVTGTTEAYGTESEYLYIHDDEGDIRISEDNDAIHVDVQVEVPVESNDHLVSDWTSDTATLHFTNRYDPDGNGANIDA